jgi:hypothetical protein
MLKKCFAKVQKAGRSQDHSGSGSEREINGLGTLSSKSRSDLRSIPAH